MLYFKNSEGTRELTEGEIRVIISSLKAHLKQCNDYKPLNIREEKYINGKIKIADELLNMLEI